MGRREAPVPDGPLKDFAEGLRELRAQAPGSPTYRELAARARYSSSALSDAAAGRRLPSWEVTAAFVTACGGDVRRWQERWRELDTRLRGQDPALLDAGTPDAPEAGSEAGPEVPAPAPASNPASAPPVALTPLSPSDPAKAGPYRLLGRLGAGSMGVVYLGVSRAGRPVAVKVVRVDLAEDPHFRERFTAEVAAARLVSGPYTAAVLEADTEAERPWLATEYLPGPTVAEAVRSAGPLPAAVVLGLAAGIAEALAAIHGAGVLHRDLTPGNVVLDDAGPKVVDFGVARAADAARLTRTGVRVGTVPFMAPEQADGREVTAAADVFALGCVLAYAATGVPPFGDGTSGEVLYRIAHADPDPAALDCGDDRLRELIGRCLHKDPGRRPTPEEIVALCGADRPEESAWLPTAAASRLAARRKEVDDTLTRAATRRTVVRVRLTAVPLVLATGIAVAVALTAGRSGSSTLTITPPETGGPTASLSAPAAVSPSGTPSPGARRSATPGRSASGAALSGQGAAGTRTPSPSPSAPDGGTSQTPTVTWTGYAGTHCASPGAAETSFYAKDGEWKQTKGGAYLHGCDAAEYINLYNDNDDGWTANADWVFTPGTKVDACSFRIHVATGTWATTAHYKVYDVDSTVEGQADYRYAFTFDQHTYDAGGWYTTRAFPFHTGTIDLTLTNTGRTGGRGVVADMVTANCS
ncbi:serine/threonine protein kinase [Streptomyces sp. NBC_00631]|uniref:protein kinase domain-containing protein n=1 Tax=Streptomyces sp. NBC_00631 TaxID=2975793 RepID=UPI0030E44080